MVRLVYKILVLIILILLTSLGVLISRLCTKNNHRLTIDRLTMEKIKHKSFYNIELKNIREYGISTTKKKWGDIDALSKKYLIPYPFSQVLVNESLLWDKKDMNPQIQLENLKLLKQFLERHNITYYIDCGTLLGAIRDKNFIKGDIDADIQVSQQDLEIFRQNIKELEDSGFLIWRNADNGYMALSLLRKGEYIDIYRNFINISFPLINYEFLGLDFPIPENYDEYLTEVYGNWKVPRKGYKGPGAWEKGIPNYTKKYGVGIFKFPGEPEKNKNNLLFELSNNIRAGKYNLNNIIPCPIYYINLDRSPDRRIFMEDQFKRLKIETIATRVNAIDGNKLPSLKSGVVFDTKIGNVKYYNNYTNHNKGELGCLLSHLVAIKRAYMEENEYVLILEDDVNIECVVLHDNIINRIILNVPINWSIISLICTNDSCSALNSDFIRYDKKCDLWSTGSYLISRKGMKDILEGMSSHFVIDKTDPKNTKYLVADIFLYNRCIENAYFYCYKKPIVISESVKDSLIQEKVVIHIKVYKDSKLYTFPNLDGSISIYEHSTSLPIPKIIHQTWKTHTLPDNFKLWARECQNIHKNYQYNLWSDDDNRNFIVKEYPNFLPTYDNYDVNIKRVDAVRYFYLYHYGGIYMDLDFLCLKNLDGLLENGKAIFGYQLKNTVKDGSIANAFMAAPPKHPLFKILIDNLLFTKDNHVLDATGPGYLTNIIKLYKKDDVVVHKMPIIYTNEWNKKDKRLKQCETDINKCRQNFPNSYTTTIWAGSWL